MYGPQLSQRVFDGWVSALDENASVLEEDSCHDEGDEEAGADMDEVWCMLDEAGGRLCMDDLIASRPGLQRGLELGVFGVEDGFLFLPLGLER